MSTSPIENFITTKEAAEISGYTSDYLSRLVRSKEIEGRKIGRSWLIERSSLESFLAKQSTHKDDLTRSLSVTRAEEYQAHRKLFSQSIDTIAEDTGNKIVRLPRRTAKKGINAYSMGAEAVSLAVAALVIFSSAAVARASFIPKTADRIALVMQEAAIGFQSITENIPARFTNSVARSDAAITYGAQTANTSQSDFSQSYAPQLSADFGLLALSMATPPGMNAEESAPAPIAIVPTASASNTPSVLPLTQKDLRTAFTNTLAFFSSPRSIASGLAETYNAIGEAGYHSIQNVFGDYFALVQDIGSAALSFGASTRDVLADAPHQALSADIAIGNAIIGSTHALIRGEVAFIYGLAAAGPAVSRSSVLAIGTLGNSLEHVVALVPPASKQAFFALTAWPSYAGPALASSVFDTEYALALPLVRMGGTVSQAYLALVDQTGQNLYAFTSSTASGVRVGSRFLAVLPGKMEDAALGVAGKGALSLGPNAALTSSASSGSNSPILAAVGETLSTGEKVALFTYQAISGIFSSASDALATIFGGHGNVAVATNPPTLPFGSSTPSVTLPPAARVTNTPPPQAPLQTVQTNTPPAKPPQSLPSRPTVVNTYPTYTTVVNVVSEDALTEQLASLRASIMGDVAGIVQPVSSQVATNISSIQQVNMIQDLSDLTVHDGNFIGGTFDKGNITNAKTVQGTNGIFTNLSGASTTLATTTISGSLAVGGPLTAGILNVAGLSSAGVSEAPYFMATDTAATSTLAGGLSVGGNAFTVLQNGLIGIGTSSPFTTLAVNGPGYFSGNLSTGGLFTAPSIATPALTLSSIAPNALLALNASSTIVATSAPTANYFTATSPTATSTLAGNLSVGGNLNFNGKLLQNNLPFISSQWTTATNSSLYYNLGNVGIGTTSPAFALDVGGFVNVGNNFGFKLNGSTILAASSSNAMTLVGLGAGANIMPNGGYQSAWGNTAIGQSALATNITGQYETAVGAYALQNATGNANTAVGTQALMSDTSGNDNSAFGYHALPNNTTGYYNGAFGNRALESNTTGSTNLASGFYALEANTTGSNNSAYGAGSLMSNVTGNNNTAFGMQSARYTTGSYNIAIGQNADLPNLAGSQQLNIGNLIYGTGLYNGSVATGTPVTGGAIGIGTTTPSATFAVAGNSFLGGNLTATGAINFANLGSGFIGANNGALYGIASSSLDLPNSALQNSALTVNGVNIALGGSGTITAATSTLLADNNTFSGNDIFTNAPKLGSLTGILKASSGVLSPAVSGVDYAPATSGSALLYGNGSGGFSNASVSSPLSFSSGTLSLTTVPVSLGGTGTTTGGVANGVEYYNGSTITNSPSLTFNGTNLNLGAGGAYQYNGQPLAFASTTLNNYFFGNSGNLTMTGSNNTATGYEAFLSDTSGANNLATGFGALSGNTTGSFNAAMGFDALVNNTTGLSNTAVGFEALYGNSTGSSNVAIGSGAGQYIPGTVLNATSSNSLYLGSNTMALASGDTNETVIGYNAVGNGSNSVTLGNTSVTKTILQGNVGIGTSTPSSKLDINGNLTVENGYQIFNTGGNALSYVGPGSSLFSGALVSPQDLGIRAAGNLGFAANGTTTPQMVLNTAGNVGIGTTNPGHALEVNGAVQADGDAGAVSYYVNPGQAIHNVGITFFDTGIGGSGYLNFRMGSSYTSAMMILNNGSIGINNTNPNYKLDVAGDVNVSTGNYYRYNGQPLAFASTTLSNYFFGSAGNLTMTGVGNVASGYGSLTQNTGGLYNTANGSQALYWNTAGGYNVANGYEALYGNTTGGFDTANGSQALYNNTTGNGNTADGMNALYYNTSATSSVAVGAYAGNGTASYSNQGGTYLGYMSGYSASTNSNYNTLLGYQSGYDITSGANNIVLGTEQTTGSGITTGSNNILIGTGVSSGLIPTGFNQLNIGNLIFGTGLSSNGTLSTGNVGIGTASPTQALSVAGNEIIAATNPYLFLNGTYAPEPNLVSLGVRSAGEFVVDSNTTNATVSGNPTMPNWELKLGLGTGLNPNDQFYIARAANATGTLAYFLNINSSGNVGIGNSNPLYKLDVNGDANVSAGNYYRYNGQPIAIASTTLSNYFFGNSGNLTMTGRGNIAVGTMDLYSNTTGINNTAIGFPALISNTVGSSNTSIGAQTLYENSSGSTNGAFGYQSLYYNTSGNNNNGVGFRSLFENTTGSYNTAIGDTAGELISGGSVANATSSYSTYLGANTMALASGDTNETIIGYNAVGNGSNTVTLGNSSVTGTYVNGNLNINTGNSYNINGQQIAIASTTLQNYFFGGAGNLTMTGVQNTGTGYHALAVNTAGLNNTANGYDSLYFNTTGIQNTAYGVETLLGNTTGSSNTAAGFQALYNNASATSSVAIGAYAGTGTASYSNDGGTYIGYSSGFNAGTGSNFNTLLGYQSGYDLSTGSYNIVLGQNVDLPSNTNNGQLNIGNLLYGIGLYTGSSPSSAPTGGFVGIGTTTPGSTLSVNGNGYFTGNVTAPSFTALSSISAPSLTLSGISPNSVLSSNASGMITATSAPTVDYITATSTTATSTFSGNLSVGNGSLTYSNATGITSINSLQTGNLNFQSDAGVVSWIDMPVTSASANGVIDSYSANLGGTPALTVFGTANGTGGLASGPYIGIGTSTPAYKLDVNGDVNVAAGNYYRYNGQPLAFASTTLNNYFFGNAGNLTMTGNYNFASGYHALGNNTSGVANEAEGYQTLGNNTSGINNTGAGMESLYSNTTGSNNSAFGQGSLLNITTSSNNTGVGFFAGRYIADGSTANAISSNSVYLGANTMALASGDTNETVIGYNAVGNGSNSVTLGNSSVTKTILQGYVGIGTTTPANLLSLSGTNSYVDVNGTANSGFLIDNAGVEKWRIDNMTATNNLRFASAGGATNVMYLTQSGYVGINNTNPNYKLDVNGDVNVSAGNYYRYNGQPLAFASTTLNNYFFGNAGNLTMTGNINTAIGGGVLQYNTTGSGNTATGYALLVQNTTGSYNEASGYETLYSNTTGSYNTANGSSALYSNTTGSQNTATGDGALGYNTTGSNNLASGLYALYYNASATSSTAIGYKAGAGLANYSNQGGTYLGYMSGYSASTNSNYNTLLGYQSGYDITSGANNIVLGTEQTTGSGITTGSNNILIGTSVSSGLSQTGSNQLNIGNLIFGTGLASGGTLSTGNVGIGTSSPFATLSLMVGGDYGSHAPSTIFAIGSTTAGTATSTLFSVLSNGNVQITPTTGAATIVTPNSQGLYITDGYAGYSIQPAGNNVYLYNQNGGNTTFGGQGANYAGNFYFATKGNFGIATSSPWAQLSVNPNDVSGPSFAIGSSTETQFVVTNGGNVGIGNSNPAYLLTLQSQSPSVRMNTSQDSSYYTEIDTNYAVSNPLNIISRGTYTFGAQGFNYDAPFQVSAYVNGYDGIAFSTGVNTPTSSSVQMMISSTGLVGVGTTTPQYKLDVKGDVNVSAGNYYRYNGTPLAFASTTLSNYFFGNAGNLTMTSSGNTANGGSALSANTTGANNTANGFLALFSNTTGSNNVANGGSTLYSNTTGANNTANGYQALYRNSTGNNNTALGYQAGLDLSTGSYNIALGQNVDLPSNTGSQQLNIGNLIYGTNLYNGSSPSAVPITGNVGIGTSSPETTLTVVGAICAARPAGTQTTACGTTAGEIFANSSSLSGGYDVAETYPTTDSSLSAGDVISFDANNPNGIARAGSVDAPFLGVVSTNPALTLGMLSTSTRAVALGGRVPVKVSTANGPIAIGDRLELSSTTPGVAVKALHSGETIGIALEAYTASTNGTVDMFVSPQYSFIGNDFTISPMTGNVGIATSSPLLGKLVVGGGVYAESYSAPQDSESFSIPQNISGAASTTLAATLPASVLTAAGNTDLNKLASYTLAATQSLATRLSSDETQITSLSERIAKLESGAITSASGSPISFSTSSLASALSSFGVLIQKGVAQFNTLVFRQLVASTDSSGMSSAGSVTIPAGNTVALVTNTLVQPSTKVFVTFNAQVTGSWWVSDKANGSFRVVLSQAQTADVSFDYFLVQTEGQIATSTPDGSYQGVPATAAQSSSAAGAPPAPSTAPSPSAPLTITLLGDNPVHISVGGTYIEQGIVVTDIYDKTDPYKTYINGVEHVISAATIDSATPTTYIITYVAMDSKGNQATATRAVIVGNPDGTVVNPVEEPGSSPTATTTPPATTATQTTTATQPPTSSPATIAPATSSTAVTASTATNTPSTSSTSSGTTSAAPTTTTTAKTTTTTTASSTAPTTTAPPPASPEPSATTTATTTAP